MAVKVVLELDEDKVEILIEFVDQMITRTVDGYSRGRYEALFEEENKSDYNWVLMLEKLRCQLEGDNEMLAKFEKLGLRAWENQE